MDNAVGPAAGANPFKVYSVASLDDLAADIESEAITVRTPAIELARTAVENYSSQFPKIPSVTEPVTERQPLILAVMGDYGAGKTHLMLYARAVLQRSCPTALTLTLQATKAPYAEWYIQVVGPALRLIGLGQLFTMLLARVAVEVADAMPLTQSIARMIEDKPEAVFDVLRDSGLNASEVERRYQDEVSTICMGASSELRRVLTALPFDGTRVIAELWLSGVDLDPADRQRLDVQRKLYPESEAHTVLAAITAASLRLGRPFAILLDEFKQFVEYERSSGDRHNVLWCKLLAESIGRQGGALVAGHWDAWRQQDDFLQRFLGRKPIELTLLTATELELLVRTSAPSWYQRWSKPSFSALEESSQGNIQGRHATGTGTALLS